MAALRRAVRADPHFAVAAIDLSVLDGSEPASAARFLHTWERHHIEVVLAAAQGNDCRAVDLLREHLTAVTCDPIAIAVVLGAPNQEPLDDILRRLPSCHHQPGTALRPSRPLGDWRV